MKDKKPHKDKKDHGSDETVEKVSETNWQEKFLRVSSDFQNFKRRVEKDRSAWVVLAKVEVIKEFLSFIDELDLAIKSSDQVELSKDLEAWLDGFKMIQRNLKKKLSELGITEIDSSGKFNPDLHEALMQVESDQHESGDIVSVLSPGYKMKDEVVRHAKVSVAK